MTSHVLGSLPTRIRRLGATVLAVTACVAGCVVGCVGLTGSGPAYAGTRTATRGANCPATDVLASTKAAMAVFEGTVDADPTIGPKTDGSRGQVYLHQVTVTTVFQGRIRSASVQVQTDRTPHQCSLGALEPGQAYLFFVQGEGSPWIAVSGGGTATASADLVAAVQSVLGQGRSPVPPTPETATFTALHPPAPQTLTRVAAPGAALVLVGVLGLMLVGGLSRRSPR